MKNGKNLLLYYNERTDQLGIGDSTWEYLCTVTMIPFVRNPRLEPFTDETTALNMEQVVRLGHVPHQTIHDKTEDWQVIGEFGV